MHILFTRFPLQSIVNGGAEKQTIALMKGLRERGHTVSFAGSCKAVLHMCKEEGIETHHIDIGIPPVTKWGTISFLWRKRTMQKKLQSLLTTGPEQTVFVMLSMSEKLLLTDTAARKGMKVFWMEHDRMGKWLRKNPWLPLLLRQSRHATTIVVSSLSQKIYEEIGWRKKDLVAIPNGIEIPTLPKHQRVNESRNKRTKQRFILGCVARLSHEKGVDVLLNAIQDLPDVSLTIVGQGPEEQKIQSMLHRINERTSKRITLKKNIANVQMFYASIDALVLPSRDHDPFGLVAAEAMMMGTVVIITDACGIANYLTNGKDAIIVQANSVESLREGISKIQNSTFSIQVAKEGQKTAHDIFSVKKMVNRYEELFTMDTHA